VRCTNASGATAEFDFGESRARIAGKLRTVHYLVGTLPASNVYFAKAYPAERLECLLDGMLCAFAFFGGVPKRAVLDNTSLAVREVLRVRERLETQLFEGFRGAFPLHADFCANVFGKEFLSMQFADNPRRLRPDETNTRRHPDLSGLPVVPDEFRRFLPE
jgi:transposase